MLSFIFGRPQRGQAAPNTAVEGNTAFALDLYGRLKSEPGNLFFSPYSISTVLAMTLAGARGDTQKQMAQVLHLSGNGREIQGAFGQLQRQLSETGKQAGIELNIANALWAQQGHAFEPQFLELARNEYQANIQQADFKAAAEPAREEINHWVAEKTKNKIQDLLPRGSIAATTRLVLANAIYFKGTWGKQFDKAATSPQPFHLSSSRQIEAPLMHQFQEVRYLGNEDFQAVELPYEGGELSMLILLPRQPDGYAGLETQLSPVLLSQLSREMRQQKVEVFLPRFKLESRFKLGDALQQMGMTDAFGSKADFSGMDGTRSLFISDVFHKAWGEVNEQGTEAAAATATTMRATAVMRPPPPPPVFRADHAFIFFIRDTRSGSLLFAGRLADPSH